ncbi:MAG: glycosyltransferase family 2 protein [Bacteroidota bacterium]
MSDLVSVIIPTYNYADVIDQAIESVLNQTYSNLECIVVDDGSTDNTVDILKQYQKLDKRFSWYHIENSGPAVARHFGVHKCNGSFIQFLDSDDLLFANKIELQIDYLNKYQSISAVCAYKSIQFTSDQNPELYSKEELETITFGPWSDSIAHFIQSNTFPIHSFLIRTEAVKEIGFKFDLRSNEDRYFWFLFALRGKKIGFQDEALIYRRIREGSNSRNIQGMVESFAEFYLKVIGQLDEVQLTELMKLNYYSIILDGLLLWWGRDIGSTDEKFITVLKKILPDRFSGHIDETITKLTPRKVYKSIDRLFRNNKTLYIKLCSGERLISTLYVTYLYAIQLECKSNILSYLLKKNIRAALKICSLA